MDNQNNANAQPVDMRALAQELADAENALRLVNKDIAEIEFTLGERQEVLREASSKAFELRGKMQTALQERYQAFVVEQCGFDPFAPVLEVQQ